METQLNYIETQNPLCGLH